MSEERKLILKMVHENRISVEEADQLLEALDNKGSQPHTGEAPRDQGQQTGQGGNIFDKAGPKVEQVMGSISSLIDSVSHTVSQQLGPNLEKRFEGWFQQKKETAEPFQATRTQEEMIPVEGGSQMLRCFHKLGDLVVEGYDGSQIQAVIEKQIHTQKVEDKLKYEDLRLVSRQDGPVMHLEFGGADSVKPEDCVIRLKLKVPASLDLDLRTESQDILLSQLSRTQGKARLESQSGDLELRGIALKHLDLQTRSGNVVVDQASELIEIQTQSGDVKLKGSVYEGQVSTMSGQIQVEAGVSHLLKLESRSGDLNIQLLDGRGRLELRSTSGDIELSGAIRAESSLQSVSGDLHCDLSLSEASVSLTTQSGDVDLILRPGSACKLEANAQSGDIECRLELQHKEQTEHGLRGVLGEGGGQVRIETQSGDVLIS